MALAFNQSSHDIPISASMVGVADLIVQSGIKYDSISIVYNKFLSAILYKPAIVEVAEFLYLLHTRLVSFVSSPTIFHCVL